VDSLRRFAKRLYWTPHFIPCLNSQIHKNKIFLPQTNHPQTMSINHWNIRLSISEERTELLEKLNSKRYPIEFSWLAGKNICIVDTAAILRFIDEELKHDNIEILAEFGQTLTSMSSGERKRTYLKYILHKKPEVLILDHFFDNLDTGAHQLLSNAIAALADNMQIINIYSRHGDEMDFLDKHLIWHLGQLKEEEKDLKETTLQFNKELPPAAVGAVDDVPEYLVEFKEVCVAYYGKPILKDISWTIKRGEFWHLCGPNGSGKTTLLTMLSGDNHKAYGQDITIFGRKKGSGETIWDIKKRIGYFTSSMTFQFWRLQSSLEMLVSGFYDSIGMYQTAGDRQLALAKDWLAFMNLERFAEIPFLKLSLGHQRMVMIARAMVKHPPLLILDEPLVDLDENSAQLVIQLINRISHLSNTTMIYVSHRAEPDLVATHIYQLEPHENGSTGKTIQTER